MRSRWSRLILVSALMGAIGLLLSLPRLPRLVGFEHLAFFGPERFDQDRFLLEIDDPINFEIKALRFQPEESRPANIGTYLVDDETREIMGPNEGGPLEWAQFLRQTRLPDDRLTVITNSLSWPTANELALRVLQEQIDQTPSLVIGLQAELANSPSLPPSELEDCVLPLDLPQDFTLPEIDQLTAPPSIDAPLFGISEVRGLKIEKNGNHRRIPLLIQWGESILPSLQLASLLMASDLGPGDLILEQERYLRLGPDGPVLPIDRSGFTKLESGQVVEQSASSLQIYPDQAETIKVIRTDDSPRQTMGLASQLSDALSKKPVMAATYRRWPVVVEIILLTILAPALLTRFGWVFILLIPAILVPSLLLSRWIMLTPLILLAISRLILRRFFMRSRGQAVTA